METSEKVDGDKGKQPMKTSKLLPAHPQPIRNYWYEGKTNGETGKVNVRQETKFLAALPDSRPWRVLRHVDTVEFEPNRVVSTGSTGARVCMGVQNRHSASPERA